MYEKSAYSTGGTPAGVSLNNACVPKDVTASPINEARGELSMRLEELHKSLSDLENRVQGVLLPCGPDTASAPTSRPVMSPLRDYLSDQAGIVRHAVERIQSILQRLEL
jgi:hypothetical protein